MKHTSKINGKTYEIGFAMSTENGKTYNDDITLIWYDSPESIEKCFSENIPPRVFVGWYFGEYDFDTTEYYVREGAKNGDL